jgi:hypothetical protein
LVALGAAAVAAAWLAALAFGGATGDRRAQLASPVDKALIDRGAYVAVAADRAACHTAPKGKPFAGGLPIATPIGAVYSANITSDRKTGIGA